MTSSTSRRMAATLLAVGALAACRSAPRPPAAPPPAATAPVVHEGGAHEAAAIEDAARRGYTAADVRFMRHMIAHHAQALEMSALVPERTVRTDMRLLAERIAVSQRDEIAMMQRWLRVRGEEVPDAAHGHHGDAGGAPMFGMLTREELAQLAGARGADFERQFLALMIRHHEGAIAMVRELAAAPGAGQEPELFRFAADVEADQRAEIRRMQAMLDALAPRTPRAPE